MDALRVSPVIRNAVQNGLPIVALESTVITHGLPDGDNVAVARRVEAAVREVGAIPATIAVLAGQVVVGLTDEELLGLAEAARRSKVSKAGSRDLPVVVARGATASTTVGGTCVVARRLGIEVFATGGIGGVHRDAATTFDESADLADLARTGRLVVSAGIKSILDVAATMERLETLGIPVVGFRTATVPGFWTASSNVPVPHRLDDVSSIAVTYGARATLGLEDRSVLVFNAVDVADELNPDVQDRVIEAALAESAELGITGPDVTPFALARIHASSEGASVKANEALLVSNARLAAELALARVFPRSPT